MHSFNIKKATTSFHALLSISLCLASFPIAPGFAQTRNYTEETREDCTNESGGCAQIVDYGPDGTRDQLAYLNGSICYVPRVPTTTAAATPARSALSGTNTKLPDGPPQISNTSIVTETAATYGGAGDYSTPGDYDGDGKTDFAIWRPSNGLWYYLSSYTGVNTSLGASGASASPYNDIPVLGDFDGDGKNDPAVWRTGPGASGTERGTWYAKLSSKGYVTTNLGVYGSSLSQYSDVAVPADYDGDGITDRAVYRKPTGEWFILQSSNGQQKIVSNYGTGGYWTPVQADYDGDGKIDVAVYDGYYGSWYAIYSTDGQSRLLGNYGGDFSAQAQRTYYYVPVTGDWNGDHKADLAVFTVDPGYSDNGTWLAVLAGVSTSLGICGDHRYQVLYEYYSPAYAQPVSPIVIDTQGDGFDLTAAFNGVRFDITGSGLPLQTAWTTAGSDDAFLVLDRNANGLIDSGKELFGNFTDQPVSGEPNGFLALAVYDTPAQGGNGDGRIDARDRIFASLGLWTDTNHDGVSQASELSKLPEHGLSALALDYKPSRKWDKEGNQFRYRAAVIDKQGKQLGRWAWDVFFLTRPAPTEEGVAPPLGPVVIQTWPAESPLHP